MNIWTRWIRQPQTLWPRKALFQLHLWTGIAVGLYIIVISATGSLLVYRNELYRAATPKSVITVQPTAARPDDDALRAAAMRAYPGYHVTRLIAGRRRDQPVDISLTRGASIKQRLFDPYTGKDLGDAVPMSIWLVSRRGDAV